MSFFPLVIPTLETFPPSPCKSLKPSNAVKVPTLKIKDLRGKKAKTNHSDTQGLISLRFHPIWSHPLDTQLGSGRSPSPLEPPSKSEVLPRRNLLPGPAMSTPSPSLPAPATGWPPRGLCLLKTNAPQPQSFRHAVLSADKEKLPLPYGAVSLHGPWAG